MKSFNSSAVFQVNVAEELAKQIKTQIECDLKAEVEKEAQEIYERILPSIVARFANRVQLVFSRQPESASIHCVIEIRKQEDQNK